MNRRALITGITGQDGSYLAELLLDEVYREEEWARFDVPWIITFFELEGDTVWGATAAMLRQLLALSLGVDDRRNYRVDP